MNDPVDQLEFLRRLHASNRRVRSKAELRAELTDGCRSLAEMAEAWSVLSCVPDRDLAEVDRKLVGLQQVLVALRAQEEPPNAA